MTNTGFIEQSIRGVVTQVPATLIDGHSVVVRGKWLKVAGIHDEEWLEPEPAWDPQAFLAKLRTAQVNADIFAFSHFFPNAERKFAYPVEWENVAAIATHSYQDWWEKKIPQETRKNVRRAAKRGVEVRVVPFDDELAAGISKIYIEDPVRQGRKFWHYGKDIPSVKKENASYLDRSEFIGAFCDGQLIGFLKMVYVRGIANFMQILAMNAHQDKRPMNALIAKAVEVCEQKGVTHLVYSKYEFNRKQNSPLAEFKRRNGCEKHLYPVYYIPLNLRGAIAVRLKLYRGLAGLLPGPMLDRLVSWRSAFYRRFGPKDGLPRESARQDPD